MKVSKGLLALAGLAFAACSGNVSSTAPQSNGDPSVCRGSAATVTRQLNVNYNVFDVAHTFGIHRYRIISAGTGLIFDGAPYFTSVLNADSSMQFAVSVETRSTSGANCVSAQELMDRVYPRIEAGLLNPSRVIVPSSSEIRIQLPQLSSIIGADASLLAQISVTIGDVDLRMTAEKRSGIELFLDDQRWELISRD